MNCDPVAACAASRLYLVPDDSVAPMRYLSADVSELNQNQPLLSRSALANDAAEDDELELLTSALLEALELTLLDALDDVLLETLDEELDLELELELTDEDVDDDVPELAGESSSLPQALNTAAASKASTRPD